MLPSSDWASLTAERKGTEVKHQRHWLHCPASTARRLPAKKAARLGTKAKPPGTGPQGGFAVCGFSATLASYLEIASDDGLTTVGARPRPPESLHDIPELQGRREELRMA